MTTAARHKVLKSVQTTITNMNFEPKTNYDYHCEFTAAVPAAKAFDGISQVSNWWATHIEGQTKGLGSIFTVRFGETFVTFTITDYQPNTKIVWTVTDCFLHWQNDKTEWTGTKLVWELTDHGKLTEVAFTHVGLRPEVECFDMCVKGWDGHVSGSLYKLLTQGQGAPQ